MWESLYLQFYEYIGDKGQYKSNENDFTVPCLHIPLNSRNQNCINYI